MQIVTSPKISGSPRHRHNDKITRPQRCDAIIIIAAGRPPSYSKCRRTQSALRDERFARRACKRVGGTGQGRPRSSEGVPMKPSVVQLSLALVAVLAVPQFAQPASGTWTNLTSGGLWSNALNWTGSVIANGTDAIAYFSTLNLAGDNTVHLDSPRGIGSLIFGDTTPTNNWVLDNNGAAGNTLSLFVSAGAPSIVVNNQTATISLALNPAQSVTKSGPGTLVLSGTGDNVGLTVNVATGTLMLAKTSSSTPDVHAIGGGGLTVNGGTAQLAGTGGDQIWDFTNVTVTSGAFDTNGRNETFFTLSLQGSGIGGAGALVCSGFNVFSTITPTNGTVLTGNTTIGIPSNASAITLNNTVSGNFALTKVGAGTLVLYADTNSFSGGLTVANGTVQAGRVNNAGTNGPLGNNTSVTLGSSGQTGTLVYFGNSAASNMPFALAAGGTGAFYISAVGVNLTLNGTISGGGALFAEVGTMTLGGSNTFTGGVTIGLTGNNITTLQLANPGALNAASPNAVTINGGTLTLLGNSVTISGLSSNNTGAIVQNGGGASATLTVNNTSNSTYAGILQDGAGSFPLALAKSGAGTLTLSGANLFTGGVTVSAGKLQLGSTTALGTTAAGTSVAAGATLDLGGQSVGAELLTISGAGVGGNGALMNSSATPAAFGGTITNQSFSVGGSGDITLTGSINGLAALTKIGAGTLTLAGTTDNTGLSLAVNAGTAVLAKTSSHTPDVHAVGWDPPLLGMVVGGGTAQLGGSGGDQIYDSANVTVTSGAFDTNARSETFATLKLQGSGIAGAGALVNSAAGDSAITPSGGTMLTA